MLSDVEIFTEFNSEITFQIRAKMAEISPENSIMWSAPGKKTKTTISRKMLLRNGRLELTLIVNTAL